MSDKYPRIFHFPFSEGIARDDRINHDYWEKISKERIALTEKLDGENTCINKNGVYARSHSVPTKNPWADYLKTKWATIKNDLENLEIFGENLYAVHSIEYSNLEHYFYVFAIRELDKWFSWEEVNQYAKLLDFPVVPVIEREILPEEMGQKKFEDYIIKYATGKSMLGGKKEGLVLRVKREFRNEEFSDCMLKWVRSDHITTDEHWTKNWRRAKLKYG